MDERVQRDQRERLGRTMPDVPGINAGRLGPHVGTGRMGTRGAWRTSAGQKLPHAPRHRPHVFGGSPDPGKALVTSQKEIAAIRKREADDTRTPADHRKMEAKEGRMTSRKKLARLEDAYLTGTCKTPEVLGAIRAGYRAIGEISPV